MPRFGSLRGKMLALILTPVAAAIILTTLFAISRASSEQRQSSFAELAQRTRGRVAEGRPDRGRRPRDRQRGRRDPRRRRHADVRRRGHDEPADRQQQERHGRVLRPFG